MEITLFLSKATGNLLEMIKYKITGLKQSQLPTHKLQKTLMQYNGGNGEGIDWLTTGITYILSKSGYSKEVRNYRPIMCLTTMYKILTGTTAKRISTHLEDRNLLSVKQKGCHPGSKCYKD